MKASPSPALRAAQQAMSGVVAALNNLHAKCLAAGLDATEELQAIDTTLQSVVEALQVVDETQANKALAKLSQLQRVQL